MLQVADEGKGPFAFRMLQYVKLQTDPEIVLLPATAEASLLTAASTNASAALGAAEFHSDPAAAAGASPGKVARLEVQLQRPSLFAYDKVSPVFLFPLYSC